VQLQQLAELHVLCHGLPPTCKSRLHEHQHGYTHLPRKSLKYPGPSPHLPRANEPTALHEAGECTRVVCHMAAEERRTYPGVSGPNGPGVQLK